MRKLTYLCSCLAATWMLLQAHAAQAQTQDLFVINVDENGNGTFVEYTPPYPGGTVLEAGNLTPALINGVPGDGLSYVLPYPITINGNSDQWLSISDLDGAQSDLINFANTGPGGVGVLNFYSNDTDGDAADVSPAFWSTISANFGSQFATSENPQGIAFWSTFIDTGGIPGDPAPHPTVEAFYYFDSGPVPEPSVIALLLAGSAGLLLKRRH